jgi:hypothetical protein
MLKRKSFKEWDELDGGLSDHKSISEFDEDALAKGTKVELEHTDDKALAEEITGDHLTEDEDYYDKLETIESKLNILAAILEKQGLIEEAKIILRLTNAKKAER